MNANKHFMVNSPLERHLRLYLGFQSELFRYRVFAFLRTMTNLLGVIIVHS